MATMLDRSLQPEIDLLFERLVTAYTKPDCYYHNFNHINHILTTIDRFNLELQNSVAVNLAA